MAKSSEARLEWFDTFELGVPEIDDDHKHLLSIMRDVQSSAEQGKSDLCARNLGKLLNDTKAHFGREEEFLRKLGYDGVQGHVAYHGELYSRAKAVKSSCENRVSREDLADCCEEMMSFLIDDIVRGDLPLKSFFEQKGLVKLQ